MTREEIEKLIAGYEHAAETNPAHTDLIIRVTAISLRELISLARLGASVAAPSEAEIEAMARGICRAENIPPDDWSATWEQMGLDQKTYNWQDFTLAARTALLALVKDSANG